MTPRVRWSPVLLASVAFSAGIAAGLRFGSRAGSTDRVLAVLALAVAAAVLATVGRRPGDRCLLRCGGRITSLCLGAVACLGLSAGSAARGRASQACTADLLTGTTVVVTGSLREPVVPSPGQSRVDVRGGTLRAADRACVLSAVTAYVAGVDTTVEAGTAVTLRGEWLRSRHRSAVWPVPPRRHGIVRGRLSPVGASPRRAAVLALVRGAASRRLRTRLPADVRPAAMALILAERGSVDARTRRRFAEAGLAHLLAISGLHVGILAAGVVWLAGLAAPVAFAWPLAAVAIGAYVASIGAPPSALRAALVFGGLAVAKARGRPARIADIAAAAGVIALVWEPLLLLDAGFQLSFAGFGGVWLGAAVGDRCLDAARVPRTTDRDGSALRRSVAAVAGGLGAFAATAPIAAAHFQRAAPVAVVSHFVGTPIVALALAALSGTVLLPGLVGDLAAGAAATLLRVLDRAAEAFAGMPLGHADVAPPSPATWLAVALGLWAALRCVGPGGPRSAAIAAVAAAGAFLAGPSLAALAGGNHALLCSLDVGQGDAAVLRTRAGHWLVFDAGPGTPRSNAAYRVLLPRLRAGGARSIEIFFLTHPDMDHLGGAEALFERYRVRRVVDSGDPIPKPSYARFLARVEESGTGWLPARAGDRLFVDEVTVTVLGPAASASGSSASRARGANETSLAFRVSVGGGFTYVNTGDATEAEEGALLRAWPADSLRADVLKVGHHGSRTSTHGAWLAAVRPTVAVISAGEGNAYGHPHAAVLARLRAAGVPRLWRTDREGTLCVEVDRRGRWRVQGEAAWRVAAAALARDLTSKSGED